MILESSGWMQVLLVDVWVSVNSRQSCFIFAILGGRWGGGGVFLA